MAPRKPGRGAFDAACDLYENLVTHNGFLTQVEATALLIAYGGGDGRFLGKGMHMTDEVRAHFWRIAGDSLVWSASRRGWRYREPTDPPAPCRRVP